MKNIGKRKKNGRRKDDNWQFLDFIAAGPIYAFNAGLGFERYMMGNSGGCSSRG